MADFPPGLNVLPLTPDDVDEVAELYADVCLQDHVIVRALQIGRVSLLSSAKSTFSLPMCQGPCSFIVRDDEGRLAGFLVSADWKEYCEAFVKGGEEKFAQYPDKDVALWKKLLHKLEMEYLIVMGEVKKKGEVNYGLMIGIHESWKGKKLSAAIMDHLYKSERKNGYKFHFGIAVHPSMLIGQKRRLEKVGRVLGAGTQYFWKDEEDSRLRAITSTPGLLWRVFTVPDVSTPQHSRL